MIPDLGLSERGAFVKPFADAVFTVAQGGCRGSDAAFS